MYACDEPTKQIQFNAYDSANEFIQPFQETKLDTYGANPRPSILSPSA